MNTPSVASTLQRITLSGRKVSAGLQQLARELQAMDNDPSTQDEADNADNLPRPEYGLGEFLWYHSLSKPTIRRLLEHLDNEFDRRLALSLKQADRHDRNAPARLNDLAVAAMDLLARYNAESGSKPSETINAALRLADAIARARVFPPATNTETLNDFIQRTYPTLCSCGGDTFVYDVEVTLIATGQSTPVPFCRSCHKRIDRASVVSVPPAHPDLCPICRAVAVSFPLPGFGTGRRCLNCGWDNIPPAAPAKTHTMSWPCSCGESIVRHEATSPDTVLYRCTKCNTARGSHRKDTPPGLPPLP